MPPLPDQIQQRPGHPPEHDEWSASAFVSYSALLGEFRYLQYLDPRDVYKGTAGDPKNSADTLWGGVAFSLAF